YLTQPVQPIHRAQRTCGFYNVLAKALYDNAAESPDELSFRKGDILTVLERDTQGLDGWWLCSLHGRQGIVPGNRLKVLVGMYDRHQGAETQVQGQQVASPSAYSKPPPSSQYTAMHPVPPTPGSASGTAPLDRMYMLPPSHNKVAPQGVYQVPVGAQYPNTGSDLYQVPLGSRSSPQDLYQVPSSAGGPAPRQDVYQVPPSMEKRTRGPPEPPGKVVLPTRGGQVYAFDVGMGNQDEYNVPRPQAPSLEVYDVPLARSQQQVYDTPPICVKPPRFSLSLTDWCPLQGYDFPPFLAKDSPDCLISQDTYDVPPNFAKLKKLPEKGQVPSHGGGLCTNPEEVYDVPPPSVMVKRESDTQEVYDIPASVRSASPMEPQGDIYDIPREHPTGGTEGSDYMYDVPQQVVHDVAPGSPPLIDEPIARLDLEPDEAMERLAWLQHAVEGSASLLVSFVSAGWRSADRLEASLPAMRQGAERAREAVRDLLNFARAAVVNAAQSPDRTLQPKLAKQLQKMEESFQEMVRHSQALDRMGWAPGVLQAPSPGGGGDDLDHLLLCLRAVPDDTKQLASFLHGNASLLFRRIRQPPLPPLPQAAEPPERINIQSRPLPAPPKFSAEEERGDRWLQAADDGWMEDYDYVHLQGKEEFEKSQKQLLEKGNIILQNKSELEQQELKQFEQLEEEVTRPINSDISGWTSLPNCPSSQSKLCLGDRQLLLFYLEQCESNVTALTNAVDAFYSSINGNQPPKIFVAHSKFVILSAHKLVFIGDTLSRQAKSPEIRACTTQHSSALCERLKDLVLSTKTAALQYPSASATRNVIDRVGELATCTQQFCLLLGQLATM
uniref:Breast cancer anti-estrogen resistance protein 1 n=1 Tax=Scleropages formosus TaxID=113540 RepID=A0A8C9WHB3_SCLFO